MQNITLKPITETDAAFLLRLFTELRADEFALVPLGKV